MTAFSVFSLYLLIDQRVLWKLYGFVYDGLQHFYPYKELIGRVVEESNIEDGDSVLDIGCGTGNIAAFISGKKYAVRYTGVDSSRSMIARAKEKIKLYSTINGNIIRKDIYDFLYRTDKKFDVIYIVNVLYALSNRTEFYSLLKKHSSRGARIVITNPDRAGSLQLIMYHLKKDNILNLFRPSLLLVAYFDLLINISYLAGRSYDFTSFDVLKDEAEKAGFHVTYIGRTYGDPVRGVNCLYVLRHK